MFFSSLAQDFFVEHSCLLQVSASLRPSVFVSSSFMAPKQAALKRPSAAVTKAVSSVKKPASQEVEGVITLDSHGFLTKPANVCIKGEDMVLPAGWTLNQAFEDVVVELPTPEVESIYITVTRLEAFHNVKPKVFATFDGRTWVPRLRSDGSEIKFTGWIEVTPEVIADQKLACSKMLQQKVPNTTTS